MRRLLNLATRLGLACCVTSVILSWILSHWYCFGVQANTVPFQLYVHVDEGGWFLDFRRPEVIPPERGIETYLHSRLIFSDLDQGSNVSSPRPLVIDQFDKADRWSLRLPGLRFLWEDSHLLFRGGYRVGLGIRHWFLLFGWACLTWLVARRLAQRTESE